MKSTVIRWNHSPPIIFVTLLAVTLAAFLFGVGLGPARLPFPPESHFSDAVTSHWSNAVFLRRSVLDDHTWPLWRPLIMSGQPFAANPLNKVWYPPQWLVLLIPPMLHLNLLIWLHLVMAGAGAWTWSRATGLTPWPAALVGFGYAFAPRLIASVGAGHLDLVYAAAWFPWLLWAIYRAAQPVPVWGSVVGLAGFASLCFLADVRLSAYAFATAVIYLGWHWWQTPALRSLAGLRRAGPVFVVAALLTVGITAVQWVPLLLLKSELSRNDLSLDDAAIHSLKPGQWIGLLIGDHGGSWETLVYVGVSTLALVIVALLLRPRVFAVWGILLVVVMLYAMGDQFVLWTVLNRLVPPLRWWRVPPRVWLVAALIMPYLAGWGAQLLAERPPDDRRIARLSVVGLLGGGFVCGISSTLMLSPPLELTAVLGTFALPAVALVMALAIFGHLSPRALVALFALVVIADVLWIDRTLIDGRPKRDWLDPYRALAEYLDDAEAVRVYSPSYSLPQQAAVYWEIPQFGGVDPFQLADYVVAAEAATGVSADGYSVTIPAYKELDTNNTGDDQEEDEERSGKETLATANRDAPINPVLLGQWLVTHVVAAFEIEVDGLELDTQIDTPDGTVYVYRNTCAPEGVTLEWDGPNRVTVRAATPYIGTLYAVADGRWKTGGGEDSPGLPGAVDDTTGTWTFVYDPSEIWASLLVGCIVIASALVGWWWTNRA